VRSNRRTPRSSSSFRIGTLSGGWLRWSRRAARPKCSSTATATNELFNAGKIDLVDELLSPHYVNHSPGSPDQPRDREAVKSVVLALRRAFPDHTIERFAGDRIVAHHRLTDELALLRQLGALP
jgi:hypothetical protein